MQTDVLDELLHADEMDKNASSEAKMQMKAMDQVSQSCDNFMYDLTISTKKTEVVHQPSHDNRTMNILSL